MKDLTDNIHDGLSFGHKLNLHPKNDKLDSDKRKYAEVSMTEHRAELHIEYLTIVKLRLEEGKTNPELAKLYGMTVRGIDCRHKAGLEYLCKQVGRHPINLQCMKLKKDFWLKHINNEIELLIKDYIL